MCTHKETVICNRVFSIRILNTIVRILDVIKGILVGGNGIIVTGGLTRGCRGSIIVIPDPEGY